MLDRILFPCIAGLFSLTTVVSPALASTASADMSGVVDAADEPSLAASEGAVSSLGTSEDVTPAPSSSEEEGGVDDASGGGSDIPLDRDDLRAGQTAEGFDIAVSGYIRSLVSYIDYDETETDFIGRNQGFGLANVRLGVRGRSDRARFVIEADGAYAALDQSNTFEGSISVMLADALAAYALLPGILEVEIGQQKVPFDGETLIPTAKLPFIRNSVWQRGVRGVEGFNVDGLGLDREVGVTLAGRRIGLGASQMAISYAAALTNGTPATEAMNENRSLAAYARLEGHFADILTVGGALYQNTRSFGTLPDLLDERHLGFAADVMASYAGGWLRANFVQRHTDYPDVEVESSRVSLGLGASIGYRIPIGLETAYRISFYDPTWRFPDASPSMSAQLEANELIYHTVGVSWVPHLQPFAAQLNYTHARENPDRAVRNDRVELLGRLVF